jgi:hypothetical protein
MNQLQAAIMPANGGAQQMMQTATPPAQEQIRQQLLNAPQGPPPQNG